MIRRESLIPRQQLLESRVWRQIILRTKHFKPCSQEISFGWPSRIRHDNAPFRFAAILAQPERSERHPFVFIDFRRFGSQKDLNTFILNRLRTLCANNTRVASSALIIWRSLFTHSLENESYICHCYA